MKTTVKNPTKISIGSSPKVIAVNLGSGAYQIAPGWINFDNSPNLRLSKVPGLRSLLKTIGILSDLHYKVKWPKEVLYRELTKPLPFESEQVDYVYTSHFLEHVEYSAAQQILQEIYRVLRPGGIARVIVPDLNHYISEYNKNAMEGLKDAGDIFMKGLNISLRHRDPHLWAYDFNSLTVQLNKAGFQTIERCEFKIGRCKDADKLDNRPIDSLIVEAVK